MKTWKKYNTFTKKEYINLFEKNKKYTDFNILWIYRSLLENTKISIEEKIEIKNLYNTVFWKTYNFLQVKDPNTYLKIELLWKSYTVADENQLFLNIQKNQEKILKDKKIKHRNFWDYSKHNCAVKWCPLDWLMIKQWSWFSENSMCFNSDNRIFYWRNNWFKSKIYKKERKNKKIIKEELKNLNY